VSVASGGEKRLLGHDDIVPDMDVVLIVKPDALADPAVTPDVKLPRKPDAGSRTEHDSVRDLGAEHPQDSDAKPRADLPRVRHEEQLDCRPQEHDRSGSVPGRPLARSRSEADDRNLPGTGQILFSHADLSLGRCDAPVTVENVTSQPLRITILGLHYAPEPTGNAPYTSSLAQGLLELGHDVRVVTGHPHYPEWKIWPGFGEWTRRENHNGVRLLRLRHYVPRNPTALKRLLSELSFGFRLLFARWGRPDVVLLVSPALFATAVATVRARWGFRRPATGVWVQDLYSRGVVETGAGGAGVERPMTAIESLTLRSATGVAVIHERFKDVVTSQLRVAPHDVVVIRNWSHLAPTPPHDRQAVRGRFGWRTDEIVVLHAGNIGAKQALENVVEAARIADQRQLGVRFVLLGDGNQRPRLERLAHGIERIQFIGPLPDDEFQQALAGADILLVNEKTGVTDMAVPSKLTSYFGTGLPVLAATDEGSVTASEIKESGGGVRTDAGQPERLVEAAIQLFEDPLARRSFGEYGRRFRQRHLSPEFAIGRYAEWLTRLAATRGR
jgi:colanic acid biosynthesis glycosyl transferase WcaI